jgi:hypothetical protein
MSAGKYSGDIAVDLKPEEIQPWAEKLYKQRREDLGSDSPFTGCLPMGPAFNLNPVAMSKIVQTPGLIVVLGEDLTYRQIFLDGRELPKDPNPSFMGYSIAHWDGDTLVVDTNGYNERTWLDFGGRPHTEDLRITERFRRPRLGRLEIEQTYSDPKIYARPWTVKFSANLITDTETLEYVCAENEKDRRHLVGKASDNLSKNSVKVAPEILAKYAGKYDFRFPENPGNPVILGITISNGQLIGDFFGLARPLIAISETTFVSDGNPLTFVMNDRGEVTEMVVQAAEGDLKARRMK